MVESKICPEIFRFFDILKMQIMQVNGASLINLKKVDLCNIGFKIYSHRTTYINLSNINY